MSEFKELIGILAYGIEGFGVLVIVIGSGVATIRFLSSLRGESPDQTYEVYRRRLARCPSSSMSRTAASAVALS